jgi:hypothetical protein
MVNNNPPEPEEEEYTPEQRKLLARAYRLILSWPRENTEPAQTCLCSDKVTDTGKNTLLPSVDTTSLQKSKAN